MGRESEKRGSGNRRAKRGSEEQFRSQVSSDVELWHRAARIANQEVYQKQGGYRRGHRGRVMSTTIAIMNSWERKLRRSLVFRPSNNQLRSIVWQSGDRPASRPEPKSR